MNYRMLEMDDVSIFFVFLFINLSYNCNFQNQNVCGVRMQGCQGLGREETGATTFALEHAIPVVPS